MSLRLRFHMENVTSAAKLHGAKKSDAVSGTGFVFLFI